MNAMIHGKVLHTLIREQKSGTGTLIHATNNLQISIKFNFSPIK